MLALSGLLIGACGSDHGGCHPGAGPCVERCGGPIVFESDCDPCPSGLLPATPKRDFVAVCSPGQPVVRDCDVPRSAGGPGPPHYSYDIENCPTTECANPFVCVDECGGEVQVLGCGACGEGLIDRRWCGDLNDNGF